MKQVIARLVELAAPSEFIPMRTLVTKAGGTAALRKMSHSKAAIALKNAAKELQAERKAKGLGWKLDKAQAQEWLDTNTPKRAGGLKGEPKAKTARGAEDIKYSQRQGRTSGPVRRTKQATPKYDHNTWNDGVYLQKELWKDKKGQDKLQKHLDALTDYLKKGGKGGRSPALNEHLKGFEKYRQGAAAHGQNLSLRDYIDDLQLDLDNAKDRAKKAGK